MSNTVRIHLKRYERAYRKSLSDLLHSTTGRSIIVHAVVGTYLEENKKNIDCAAGVISKGRHFDSMSFTRHACKINGQYGVPEGFLNDEGEIGAFGYQKLLEETYWK